MRFLDTIKILMFQCVGSIATNYHNLNNLLSLSFLYLCIRYSNVIQDSALWSMYYAGFLLLILPTNFVLSFIPRGFPTSVKTQRPESTFWAAVTLITSLLCAAAFGANAYELFGVNNGMNLATATYQEDVSSLRFQWSSG